MLKPLIKILFWSFIAWLIVRTFMFQTYRIPSSSMYGSLFEGDFVVINKLAYGPRLPAAPLALTLNGSLRYLDWISLPYIRIPGYSEIKRNDVVAFNYELQPTLPTNLQEEFIKRCVALPGDTLKIIAGKIYANGEEINTANIYNKYTIAGKKTIDTLSLKRSGAVMETSSDDGKHYVGYMTTSLADSLSNLKEAKSVTAEVYAADYYHPSVYPNHSEFPWNYDHFGPLWIPKKGDSVLINKRSLILYQRCIETYEKKSISYNRDTILISGKPLKYYTFEQNYYFLLGDNRHNSIDSRITGLIPEDHIIGKASFIAYSSHRSSRKFSAIK